MFDGYLCPIEAEYISGNARIHAGNHSDEAGTGVRRHDIRIARSVIVIATNQALLLITVHRAVANNALPQGHMCK